MAACELGSWDAAMSSNGATGYTWWLDDGYGLHAFFANGPGTCSNCFGPCCISYAGELAWKLTRAEDKWNTILGLLIVDMAVGPHPHSQTGG